MAAKNAVEVAAMARRMRRKILDVSHACNASTHLGGGLSIVDVTATLYGAILRFDTANPRWEDRDRFILSKGHGVLGYFSALLAAGIISEEKFASFLTNGSDLIAHPVMNLDLGIESSNGSLGHGLSLAIGLALAARKKGQRHQIYVLMGDGECNEGAVWEAVMSAAQLGLDNLTAIVDYNRLQSDGDSRQIIDFGDLAAKFRGFGWDARDVDGHCIPDLLAAFSTASTAGRPRAMIAHTTKGKGVSFMENNNEWHHSRLTKAHYERAIAELGES
jgi:transketolase